jgi:hypothetical protein
MPFQTGIDILAKIAELVAAQIEKDAQLNKDIKKETHNFTKNMQILSTEISIINDKLRAYQALQPTTEEVHDLKGRTKQLFINLKNLNSNLIHIQETYNEFLLLRENYKKTWCICKNIYTKSNFIEDIKSINEDIEYQLDMIKKDFMNLEHLMNIYSEQVENLKFKFIPLRRLWISNKWDSDANQDSQRVTIETFCQEIQSKDTGNWGLTSKHYENMKNFLHTMIIIDKTEDQLDAIGKGRSCGTYFISSSLLANLTNLSSDYYKWHDLSDLVIYFSLEALKKPTDDKITDIITKKYNAEIKLRELRKSPEHYKAYKEALIAIEKAENEKAEMKKQSDLLNETLTNLLQTNLNTQIQSMTKADSIYKGKGDSESYATFGTVDGIFRIKKGGIYTVEVYLHVRNFNFWNNIYLEHYKEDMSSVARHCIIDVVQNWDYNATSKHQLTLEDNDYLRVKFSAKSSDITWKSECYIKIY